MGCVNFAYLRVMFMTAVLLGFVSSGFADTANTGDVSNIEASVGLGAGWFGASNTSFQVTNSETDSVIVNHAPTARIAWGMGVGYHAFANQLSGNLFLTDLLFQLHYYHETGRALGDVWAYQDSTQNNYTFQAPLVSNRLMLEARPSLWTVRHFSFYPIVGVGYVWDRLRYDETVIPSSGVNADSYFDLATQSNNGFEYDAGAGIRYQIHAHLSAAIDYVYTDLNHVASSTTVVGGANQTPLTAPVFAAHSQDVLFNLIWRY